ncbi:MAG: hypothetical protein R3253_13025, partial [Longimicrobiales bacterium]|nr:hypothetical protein [Longimicrobiales bacterium]
MIHRVILFAALVLASAACAGGPAALEYGLPADRDLRYSYADTTTVGISVMGQSLEMAQRGVAEYAVSFSPAPAGVNVTMSVSSLEGALSQPMGAPVRFDQDDVQGVLVFSLDRRGNAVIAERPAVSLEARQFVSGLVLANHFFPGLPGGAAGVGDSWVDTVSYRGSEGSGERSETAILRYTVVGDTLMAGRVLTEIGVQGTSE